MIFTNAKKKNRVDFSVMFVQLFGIVFGQKENINNIGTMKRDFRKYTHSHKNCRFHVYKIGKVRKIWL